MWLFAVFFGVPLLAIGCDDGDPASISTAPAVMATPKPPLATPAGPPSEDERISFYVDLLEGGGIEEVQWATLELRKAGQRSIPFLARALGTALRKNALFAVNIAEVFAVDLSGKPIVDLLSRASLHRDGPLRIAAARALGASGAPEAAAPLLDLVGSGFDNLADQAIRSIEELGAPEGVRGLLGRFPDRVNPRAGRRAVLVLARHLPEGEALRFLFATLSSEHVELALAAAKDLLRRDAAAHLPAVRARLEGELGGPYRDAILSQFAAGRDPKLLDSLVEEGVSENPAVAIAAAERLGNYPDEVARQALWKATGSKVEAVRQQAYHALLASGAPRALERLVGLFESPDADDRYLAAYILASEAREGAVAPLIAALERERDLRVTKQLCVAVAQVARERGAAALTAALGRETVREPSLATLANTAAKSLLFAGWMPPEAVPALLRLGESDLPSIRMNAAMVIGARCGGPEVAAALEKLLFDDSVDVRRAALESWLLLPEATVEPLVRLYEVETDEDLVRRIRAVIDQLRHRWGQ